MDNEKNSRQVGDEVWVRAEVSSVRDDGAVDEVRIATRGGWTTVKPVTVSGSPAKEGEER